MDKVLSDIPLLIPKEEIKKEQVQETADLGLKTEPLEYIPGVRKNSLYLYDFVEDSVIIEPEGSNVTNQKIIIREIYFCDIQKSSKNVRNLSTTELINVKFEPESRQFRKKSNKSTSYFSIASNKGKQFPCFICKKVCTTLSSQRRHVISHFGSSCCVICKFCGWMSIRSDDFIHHYNIHATKPMKQNYNSIQSSRSNCKRRRSKKHTTATYNIEDEIDMKTETHLRTEKILQCVFCLKQFTRLSVLKNHVSYHTKPVKCTLCFKGFSHKSKLKLHERIHKGERPFECEICLRSLSTKQSLISHLTTHTGDKPFKCEFCPKSFSTLKGLAAHNKIHSGEKPFKCEICFKLFVHKNSLKNHLQSHTGEKPFQCEICSLQFTQKSHLNVHLKTHTAERPFKCEICSKPFTFQFYLNRHMKHRHGDKPFKCEICLKEFSQKHVFMCHSKIHTRDT